MEPQVCAECGGCGGCLLIGVLGALSWHRCRACGWEQPGEGEVELLEADSTDDQQVKGKGN